MKKYLLALMAVAAAFAMLTACSDESGVNNGVGGSASLTVRRTSYSATMSLNMYLTTRSPYLSFTGS